jgi:aminoglycoside phosphotransferase (APT) family kinase protein
MASIGPAELDLAWFTALEAMTEHFFGQRVPGFLTRDEVVARHEQALGRSLVDFRWFEVFAMCRSTALNLRTDRLGSIRRGRTPRPAEDNAVLAYTSDVIATLS